MLVRACVIGASLLAVGCRAGSPPSLAEHPDAAEALGQARCGVRASADKPLVIEWPAAERAALEARAGQGLVAVRYQGCEMEVLSQCSVPGAYDYVGLTTKHETVRIRGVDELYARLPLGAASLEAQLERSGQLTVDLTVVGRREADAHEVSRLDLRGNCEQATHFVSGLTVGAFSVYTGQALGAGAGVEVAGAGVGGQHAVGRETLRDDGDPAACTGAGSGDEVPPQGCGALLRVEVVPLSEHAVARRPEPEPATPATEPAVPATSEPSSPRVEPDAPGTVCDEIDFEVVEVSRRRAEPPIHERSMDRVSLRISNRGARAVELQGGSEASFLDGERGLIETDVRDEWWMPRGLPAGSSVIVRVLMPRNAGKTLRGIEVEATPEGQPFSRCKVVDDRLEPAEPSKHGL